MNYPDGVSRHAEQVADSGTDRPTNSAFGDGISAAYYAVFRDLSGDAASHLDGSFSQENQNQVRGSSKGEISQVEAYVVDRTVILQHSPIPRCGGSATGLVRQSTWSRMMLLWFTAFGCSTTLRRRRHAADYDHGERFSMFHLVDACEMSESRVGGWAMLLTQLREALFMLLTVRRADLRQR